MSVAEGKSGHAGKGNSVAMSAVHGSGAKLTASLTYGLNATPNIDVHRSKQ